ncbi:MULTISPECIES: hypothetical protein [unclassified Mesorhizobium]|jgi:hypothetical protein|nr:MULTISPECIES: hypothetical protein [unclassified Mesorhizobium]
MLRNRGRIRAGFDVKINQGLTIQADGLFDELAAMTARNTQGFYT